MLKNLAQGAVLGATLWTVAVFSNFIWTLLEPTLHKGFGLGFVYGASMCLCFASGNLLEKKIDLNSSWRKKGLANIFAYFAVAIVFDFLLILTVPLNPHIFVPETWQMWIGALLGMIPNLVIFEAILSRMLKAKENPQAQDQ